MVIVAVLNAGRNSFSFFLLLIVCLGYGVVKSDLGKTMLLVRGLAAAHFVFGVIYAVASLTITPDSAGTTYLYTAELPCILTVPRAAGSPCHSSLGRNADSILRLDFECAGRNHERLDGSEAKC